MRRALVLLLIVGGLSARVSVAAAQVRGPRLHAGVGFALDFGGEVEFDPNADVDLDPTVGIRGHLDYAVHRHVSIGGLVRMSWWEPDSYYGQDRSFLFDLGPRVVVHFDWRDFRFYAGPSLGLTISAINDDWGGGSIDNPGLGPTLTLTVAGVEWWFARRTGLFAELGWVGHWFEHEVGRGDVDVSLSQGLFEFGLVFGG